MKAIRLPLLLMLVTFWWNDCQAGYIYNVPGVKDDSGIVRCPGNDSSGFTVDRSALFKANSCNVPASGYVAKSGYYSVQLVLGTANMQLPGTALTSSFYVDATKPLEQQNITTSSSYDSGMGFQSGSYTAGLCYYLVNGSSGEQYKLYGSPVYGNSCQPAPPLPPTPVPPSVSCKINNGNNLEVNLGTLDRAVIPTVPGSGQPQSAQFPVTCTGGAATMKMQLNYTPITVSGSQVVNSSINGLGVAVSYNDKILAPSDITTMQFPEGNTDVTLKFEAVRNPSVEVADIKTGPFTASAVLVMTQQ